MQKFIDRRGRVWIVDIDNTTLRRVKTLTDVRLLDAIDGDLINRLATDPLLLGDVLFAICKPQADQQDVDDEAFAEGLAGDAIDEACKAVVGALVAYHRVNRDRHVKQRLREFSGLSLGCVANQGGCVWQPGLSWRKWELWVWAPRRGKTAKKGAETRNARGSCRTDGR